VSFRYWVTQSTIDDVGHDAQAVLWTEAYFKSVESNSGPVLPWRVGADSIWTCVLNTRTGTVNTAVDISAWTATMTIFDPLTAEVISTPTVTILDTGVATRGKFGLMHLDTDTPAPGQWKFSIVFTVGGALYDIIQGWIDILPAVPT
jgi:hypothetical protein